MPEMLTPTSIIMGAGLGTARRADHRRPLLGRLARLHHRPRRARGAGRRADRAGARRRSHRDRRQEARASISTFLPTSWNGAAARGPRRRCPRRAACWRATSARCVRPRRAASPTSERVARGSRRRGSTQRLRRGSEQLRRDERPQHGRHAAHFDRVRDQRGDARRARPHPPRRGVAAATRSAPAPTARRARRRDSRAAGRAASAARTAWRSRRAASSCINASKKRVSIPGTARQPVASRSKVATQRTTVRAASRIR